MQSLRDLDLSDEVVDCVRRALAEDIGPGDVTTNSIVPADADAVAHIVAKQDGVVSGLRVAQTAFLLLSDRVTFYSALADGSRIVRGQTLAEVAGPARAILTSERTALNFLARMSGIATLTRRFVDAVAGTEASILDTRKTAPGLRSIDKIAVRHGGGVNHRFGLFDMVLIKNNHIDQAGSPAKAVQAARSAGNNLEIEIEARNIEEVRECFDLAVDRVLLDNMSIAELRKAVALGGGRVKLEASGNVSLDNVRAIAETGVDFISVGALTHSAPVLDVSLKWIK